MQADPVIQNEIPSPLSGPKRWRPRLSAVHNSSTVDRVGATPVTPEELRALQQAFDRYEIVDCIERGGQGVVYRAKQKGSSRAVALKLLLDGPLAGERQRFRFEREIELVARLRHPNIVTLFDSGIARGRLFYAMEYIDGLQIDDYAVLQDLSPRSIVQLMVPVCRAIHFAHQNGVIHRDLKPAHILVGVDGQPRVFDFGLAKDVSDSSSDAQFSCTGQVVGTLPYLSPEQAGGHDGKSDVRSDVYALGVILFQLMTELFPYPVDGPHELVRRTIIGTEPLALRKAVSFSSPDRALRLHEVNRDLEAIVAKALRKEKDERYQSAGELADDLDRYLKGEAVTARAGSRWYTARKAIRKHRVATGVGLTLILATVGMSVAWLETRVQRDFSRGAAETAVNSWLFAVETVEARLRTLPGGFDARNELIRQLLADLPHLESFARSDPRLSTTVMKLLERKGDIEFKSGKRGEAAESFRELFTRAEKAIKTEPNSEAHRLRIVAARGLAMSNDWPEALYESALASGQQSLNSCPDDDNVRREFCETLVEFASYLRRCREENRGLESVDRALRLMPDAAFAPKGHGPWTRVRARALGDRGAMLLKLGRGEEGLRDLYAALDIRERVAALCPADTSASDDLMCAYYRTGLAERDRGMISDAIARFERGVEVSQILAKLDPMATTWDRNRFLLHHELARLQLNRKDLAHAHENCVLATELADRAASGSANAPDTREDLALAAILQGRLYLDDGDTECALLAFERAAGLREALAAQFPSIPVYLQQLAEAHYWLGAANRKLGRLDEAQPRYERALAYYSRLSDRDFDVENGTNHLRAQLNLAVLFMNYNRTDMDDRARELLNSTAQQLDQIRSSDRFLGNERRFDQIESALNSDIAILEKRDNARQPRIE
jgi:serine/threonine protein kinase